MTIPVGWRPPPPHHWDDLTLSARKRLHAAMCALAAERDALLQSGATVRAVPLDDDLSDGDRIRAEAKAIQQQMNPEPAAEVRRRRAAVCGVQTEAEPAAEEKYTLAEIAAEYLFLGQPLPREAAPRMGISPRVLEKRLSQARAAGLLPPSPHQTVIRSSA